MPRTIVLVVLALVAGGAIGVGGTLAVGDDEERAATRAVTATAPREESGPRILCETDAASIASQYQESGADLNLKIDCQQATGPDESPLEGASLVPEYRCFLTVQLASNPYNLDCAPIGR